MWLNSETVPCKLIHGLSKASIWGSITFKRPSLSYGLVSNSICCKVAFTFSRMTFVNPKNTMDK